MPLLAREGHKEAHVQTMAAKEEAEKEAGVTRRHSIPRCCQKDNKRQKENIWVSMPDTLISLKDLTQEGVRVCDTNIGLILYHQVPLECSEDRAG